MAATKRTLIGYFCPQMDKRSIGWIGQPPERPLLALSVAVTGVLLWLMLALTGSLGAFFPIAFLYAVGFGGLFVCSFLTGRISFATTPNGRLLLEVAAVVGILSFAAYLSGNSLQETVWSSVYSRKDIFSWLDPYLIVCAGRCAYYVFGNQPSGY